MMRQAVWIFLGCMVGWMVPAAWAQQPDAPQVLAGTQPLTSEGDLTSQLVDQVDAFLLRQLAGAADLRAQHWPKPTAGRELAQWQAAVEPWRQQLSTMIGLRDRRVEPAKLWLESEPGEARAYASGQAWRAERVRWPVLAGVDGSGLWVQPQTGMAARFRAVVVPDAGQTPEQLIGMGADAGRVAPIAAQLAAAGGEVVVTTPISRHREARRGRAVMTDQEFLYRSAFELGRHALGYQVHEVLAAAAALRSLPTSGGQPLPLVMVGWGEGGWVALHAAAVSRASTLAAIDVCCVSGHFQSRDGLWREPSHRNLHGVLNRLGDAEIAALVAPGRLVIDAVAGPQVTIGGDGGAPGELTGPTVEAARAEFARTQQVLEPWKLEHSVQLVVPAQPPSRDGPSQAALEACLQHLKIEGPIPLDVAATQSDPTQLVAPETRRLETLHKWDRHSQFVLSQADQERAEYWKGLKTDTLENFSKTVEPYRAAFRDEVIGRWELPLQEPQPRSRLVYSFPDVVGYEVVLDVFDGVTAYGVLLMPRNIKAGERRPCVVFQHGLEGRPKDTIEGDHPAYHDVSRRLAEQGFIVFAPQNLYIFRDRFRTLQRKSNPLGKTLFSVIVPQHQQLCRWLGTLPEVDPSRIAFYGLSYGGKSAMRIPPLVPEYCLSICSADFNDWVWKNASTASNYSYVWTLEYEIFEFDLGSRFNYAEMATLIAPRPFMVERGHFDGVAPDDRVAAEFAKVRHLYSAKLGLQDAARLEWFVGPHTINGQGTFQFLHEKLNWPAPVAK